MAVSDDHVLAALFAGFSIGFGWFTVWEAVKQTRRIKQPLRSTYVWMVWGEILVNIPIVVLGWLLLDGVLPTSLPVLFTVLFFWVFETQLQPQIIINRIGIIANSPRTVTWVKWLTFVFVGLINISVFIIWIPSHIQPPPSDLVLLKWFVDINYIYDRITKVLILILNAGLNWWFAHVVKQRLVTQHQLVKYKPLISFTNKTMFISIMMDVCLVALLSLPNELVYIQFHPCAYLVKLQIELSMASLITRLARGQPDNDFDEKYTLSSQQHRQRNTYHHNRLTGSHLSKGDMDIELAAAGAGNTHNNDNKTKAAPADNDLSRNPSQVSRLSAFVESPTRRSAADESSSGMSVQSIPWPTHPQYHHHRQTMSQDRGFNFAFGALTPTYHSTHFSIATDGGGRRSLRRQTLTDTRPGLSRTRFGYYAEDEISLTRNAGRMGGGRQQQHHNHQQQQQQQQEDQQQWQEEQEYEEEKMEQSIALFPPPPTRRKPPPPGTRRPSVTR